MKIKIARQNDSGTFEVNGKTLTNEEFSKLRKLMPAKWITFVNNGFQGSSRLLSFQKLVG